MNAVAARALSSALMPASYRPITGLLSAARPYQPIAGGVASFSHLCLRHTSAGVPTLCLLTGHIGHLKGSYCMPAEELWQYILPIQLLTRG